MPNHLAITVILTLTLATYVAAMWVTKVTNARGDKILFGVINGVEASPQDRRLMLVTMWLPYAAFLIAFLLVMAIGTVEFATSSQDPRVQTVGFMCALFLGAGGVFWFVLGFFFVLRRLLRSIRQAAER